MGILLRQLRAGWAAFHNKDYARAIDLYKSTLPQASNNPTTLGTIAYCYNELSNLDDAIQYCNQALKLDSNHYFSLQVLAQVYAKKNEDEKAYELIQSALSNRSTPPNTPKRLLAFFKAMMRITGHKDKEDSIDEIWNEPEDTDVAWLEWAERFRQSYDAKLDRA